MTHMYWSVLHYVVELHLLEFHREKHTKKKKKKKKIGKLERMRGGEAKVGCARAAAYQHPTNLPRHIPDTFEALFAF